jgi:hypothetical protein
MHDPRAHAGFGGCQGIVIFVLAVDRKQLGALAGNANHVGRTVDIHAIVGVGQTAGKWVDMHIAAPPVGDARDQIVDRGHRLLQQDRRKTEDD